MSTSPAANRPPPAVPAPGPAPVSRERALTFALIGVTAVWGATFPLVKVAAERVGVFEFNAVRFALAALVLGAVSGRRLTTLGKDGWLHGALLGVALCAGYAFQTVGLLYTTATNAGFVTGMFVVFTPLLAAAFLRRSPGWAAVVGAIMAFVGLALMSLTDSFTPRTGDVIVLGCALAFAFHIVGLGAWASRHDAMALTVVQLLVVGAVHAVLIPWADTATGTWDVGSLGTLLLTALVASAVGFWVQTATQRVVAPTRTAVILTMEPVFAGFFGFVLLGEWFGVRGLIGSALILAGMLLAELRGAAPTPAPPEDQAPAAAEQPSVV